MWLDAPEWAAVLRIGLGLWWLESFRHKNKRAWIREHAGIAWASSVAEKHRWGFVRSGFAPVARRPALFTWIVLGAELSLGLGITAGFLTPIALWASVGLNALYFVMMIHDWAEQGQNLMMMLAAVVAFGLESWTVWSVDDAIGLWGT